MGCLLSADANSAAIEKMMENNEKTQNMVNKLLFLGPGGSGKSTIFKQIQYIHGFANGSLNEYKKEIHNQILQQMQHCIKKYTDSDTHNSYSNNMKLRAHASETPPSQEETNTVPASPEFKVVNSFSYMDGFKMTKSLNFVKNFNILDGFSPELADAIAHIWNNDPNIQNAFKNVDERTQFLYQTTPHFFDNLDRIKQSDYRPTEEDVIFVRARTLGIIEKKVKIRDNLFVFVDVGGQKNERKKWIQCFVDVTAIVFVVNLASYNEFMFEDTSKNCMEDALEVFGEVVNNKFFKDTNIILFLNKSDLFLQKIEKIAITKCPVFDGGVFEEYSRENDNVIASDPNDYTQSCAFVEKQFLKLNQSEKRHIHCHTTCALNRNNIQTVFEDVQKIVVGNNLQRLNYL